MLRFFREPAPAVAIVGLLGLVLGACDNASHVSPSDSSQFAYPERDASHAIAHGDLSLRGVLGFAIFVPGIQGDYEVLRKKYQIEVIAGTSDTFVSGNPTSFGNQARSYASRYNSQIFLELGCKTTAPMDKCARYPR
jgi:hypothetical protein